MSFEPSARRRSEMVREMFSRLVGRYDLMNRLMTFGLDQRWRKIAAQAAGVLAGGLVLDMGTGTGDLAVAVARHSKARSVIAGDYSVEMLRAARSKLRRVADSGLLHFAGIDALDQPFAAETFDCVTQAFVIRNVADPANELAETLRVLKPGGTTVLLELVSRGRGLMSYAADAWTELIVPVVGQLVTGDGEAYRYLIDSAKEFHTVESLAQLVEDAGFVEVRWHRFAIGSVVLLVAKKPSHHR